MVLGDLRAHRQSRHRCEETGQRYKMVRSPHRRRRPQQTSAGGQGHQMGKLPPQGDTDGLRYA